MSKFTDEFILTHRTTGKLRKLKEEFKRHNKQEIKKIDKILNRFGRRFK